MFIIVLTAIVILLLIWGIATYNRLVTERLKVQTQWSQIDVVLKQRFDLIPNLLETVKGYAAHEKEALQGVTDARSHYLSAADTQTQMKAGTELSGAMSRLMAVAESYPELKANRNFLHLQQQLSAMEERGCKETACEKRRIPGMGSSVDIFCVFCLWNTFYGQNG